MLSPPNKSRIILSVQLVILPLICFIPALAAAGGHGDTGELEYRIDTEDLSGISLFLANLYNDNRLLFAIVATSSMAILGAIIAIGTEYVLKLAGFTVSRADHRE